MSSLISKKRIFFEKPSLGDVSQYTYLETNTSTNYLDSDGVPVIYDKLIIGNVRADLIINNNIIIELKAISTKISDKEIFQIKKYMNLTKSKFGLLVNFSQKKNTNIDIIIIDDDNNILS